MRRIKKALSSLILICILCPCISLLVHAASAELFFSDPSTTVGAEVEVKVKLTSSSELASLDATLTYDADMLRFISGDDATGGSGTITLAGVGEGTSIDFVLNFQALKEGTANIEVSQSSGTDSAGSELDITNGSSAVTIGPGDPSLIQPEDGSEGAGDTGAGNPVADGPQVEVDGVQYIVTNGFSDAVIPQGFSRGEMTFEGTSCEVVTQPVSNVSALYLTPAAGGDAEFFLYDIDKGSLIPFEQVSIASDRYLVPLRDDGSVSLPERFQQTKLILNGKEFTAWNYKNNAEYYMLYALNTDGEKAIYQYDAVDKTYQRYVQQAGSADDGKKKPSVKGGLWGKLLQFIEDFLDIVVILFIMFVLILIVVLIVIGVKLYHRNLELDDLYDEYGIDLDDDDKKPAQKEPKSVAGKGKKTSQRSQTEPAVRVPAKTMNLKDDDIFDDFEDLDDIEDLDDFDDEDGGFDDYEDDFDYDDYDRSEDDAEDIIDDLDELLSMQPKKKRSHMEKDDSFQVDFIDLD